MGDETDAQRENFVEEDRAAYTAEHIVVLDGLTAVRRRPGMYIGDLSDGTGQHHMVWEVVGNSIDEHLGGHARRVHVTIDDGTVTIDDDGRGIDPANISAFFTQMHHSGTRDGHHPHVHAGWGLFGLGLAPINALSAQLEVEVHHNGSRYRARYARGDELEPPTLLGATRRSGTRIRFTPDPTLFDVVPFDKKRIAARLWELACLNPGLELALDGHKFVAPCGGADHVRHRGATPQLVVHGAVESVIVDVVLGSRDAPSNANQKGATADICGFVSQFRSQTGAHIDGLWDAFEAVHPEVSPSVVRELVAPSLVAWVNVGLYDPSFGDPTRNRLASPEARRAVATLVTAALEKAPHSIGPHSVAPTLLPPPCCPQSPPNARDPHVTRA